MKSYSTKTASRRLSAVLKDAQLSPVFIDFHGRPRAAVVSISRYELYEKLLRKAMDEMAVEALNDSLDAAREGKFKTAARLRLMARSMGRGGA